MSAMEAAGARFGGYGSKTVFLTPIGVDFRSIPPYQLLCTSKKEHLYPEILFRTAESLTN